MKHDEHARMHIRLLERAKKDTIDERKKILYRIIKEPLKMKAYNNGCSNGVLEHFLEKGKVIIKNSY